MASLQAYMKPRKRRAEVLYSYISSHEYVDATLSEDERVLDKKTKGSEAERASRLVDGWTDVLLEVQSLQLLETERA